LLGRLSGVLDHDLERPPVRQQPDAAAVALGEADLVEEVTRVLSRLRNVTIADRNTFKKDVTYQAGIRMRLDTAQLPKPFQLNAIASRDWTLASDWHRWSITP